MGVGGGGGEFLSAVLHQGRFLSETSASLAFAPLPDDKQSCLCSLVLHKSALCTTWTLSMSGKVSLLVHRGKPVLGFHALDVSAAPPTLKLPSSLNILALPLFFHSGCYNKIKPRICQHLLFLLSASFFSFFLRMVPLEITRL